MLKGGISFFFFFCCERRDAVQMNGASLSKMASEGKGSRGLLVLCQGFHRKIGGWIALLDGWPD
jgi:hypothetical protein